MDEKYRQALLQDIEKYSKLKNLKKTTDFEEYLDFLQKSLVSKMLQAFLGKEAPSQEEFLAIWGEVRGKLHVIQEVGGAELIEKQLLETLKEYNNPQT